MASLIHSCRLVTSNPGNVTIAGGAVRASGTGRGRDGKCGVRRYYCQPQEEEEGKERGVHVGMCACSVGSCGIVVHYHDDA